MQNIYPDLMIKIRLSGNKKRVYIFFPDFSCICIDVCAYVHVTFLVVEIADRFLGQALYG